MTLNITLPSVGKPKTVKDAVISILSNEWPLSAKKIYNRVKSMGFSVSYQAVHKALIETEKEGVITKNGREFRLNDEWLGKIKDFGKHLKNKYKNGIAAVNKSTNGTSFSSLHEMDMFVMGILETVIENSGGEMDDLCSHWRHTWWPLFISREGYSTLKKVPQPEKIFITCGSNSTVEEWCVDFYNKIGANVKININIEDNFDFMILGDTLIQMYWPDDLKRKMDDIFSRTKVISDLDLNELFENVFEHKTDIHVVFIKSKEIAEQFKERVLGCFS